MGALAIPTKLQPMIFALDSITDEVAQMERRETMGTSVAYRFDRSLTVSKKQNGLFEQGSVKEATRRNLIIPSRHVPYIFKCSH
jgi:hypothetical protein